MADTQFDRADLERRIVDQIKTEVGKLAVQAYPGTADGFADLPVERGCVLVAYQGLQLSPFACHGDFDQDGEARFAVSVLCRDLRHEGCYDHLEAVRRALTGFEPIDECPMRFVSEDYAGQHPEDPTLWIWVAVYAMAVTLDTAAEA